MSSAEQQGECEHDVVLNKKCYYCGEEVDFTTIKKVDKSIVPLRKLKKRDTGDS